MTLQIISTHKCFGGDQGVYTHLSSSTGTEMTFSVFMPEQSNNKPVPVLFYLSGLTCSWENFTVKGGAQRFAAEHGIAIISPDTSPRGSSVPDDSEFDMGQGAGFYLNATEDPWKTHFQMEDYITRELPALVNENFEVDINRLGVTGHSMGGHGALTLAMKNPDIFKSLSAFSPISSPMNCGWGQKALAGYLGDNVAKWAAYDACTLIDTKGWDKDILVDQGGADAFLDTELLPDMLVNACRNKGIDLNIRLQEGYDHSYYFVSTFMGDHIAWHAARL